MANIYANRIISGAITWEDCEGKTVVKRLLPSIAAALIAKGHPELVPEEYAGSVE